MMIPVTVHLSDRDRRTLARGAIAISVLLALTKGFPAWRSWQSEAMAGATEIATDARRSDGVIAAYATTCDSLRVRFARVRTAESALVTGDDPAAAAATLATMIADAAADAGVTIGAVQPRVDSEPRSLGTSRTIAPPAYAHVSVHGDAVGDVVAVTQFLADLEHGPTLLAVRELSISQVDPAAPTNRMETLHTEFTVVGLARAAGAEHGGHDSRPPASPIDSHSRAAVVRTAPVDSATALSSLSRE